MWNNESGEFVRYLSRFRQQIRSDGSTRFKPEAGRYHLYISWACPWAHRTAIVRSLLGLEDAISLSAVDPVWNERGWTFSEYPGATPDHINHRRDLIDVYRLAVPGYEDEETTPVLWDKKTGTIVNNESVDIIRMLATEFLPLAHDPIELYPARLRDPIDGMIDSIYSNINNGVYRAGFATSQAAYEEAYRTLFGALDHWEAELGSRRYLCGDSLTIADICLFTTLYRFDLVYYSHFKCNQRHVYEYPSLWGFVRDLHQMPEIRKTCLADHVKRHYYMSQTDINPTRIVPLGPELDYDEPHYRERLNAA